ncbi:MAG: ABC transporter permease [Halobacteria archaeon]|nr:ABC transporter permease [Halobacteria archaeon]
MIESLVESFEDPVVLKGLKQVGAATAIALVVLAVSSLRGLGLEREMGAAFVRGFVQVLLMGSVIGLILTLPVYYGGVVLIFMLGGAAWISKDRAEGFPGVLRVASVSVTVGATTVILTMTAVGAIEPRIRDLVPVGSMVIANSMKTNSLALDRLKDEIESNRERIEAGLSLGAAPSRVVSRHVETGVRASLIPVIDSLKSLGWVWIPGIMTGMIISGTNPVYAAEYQFVIMAMIFAGGGLTSMTSSLLVTRYAFTDAEQLRSFDRNQNQNQENQEE